MTSEIYQRNDVKSAMRRLDRRYIDTQDDWQLWMSYDGKRLTISLRPVPGCIMIYSVDSGEVFS